MKYVLKDNEWIPEPDSADAEERFPVLKKIKHQPKYVKKQFEIAWNEIFMLRMIVEMRSPDEFYHDVLPDLLIAKA